jgi:hypothetical protein
MARAAEAWACIVEQRSVAMMLEARGKLARSAYAPIPLDQPVTQTAAQASLRARRRAPAEAGLFSARHRPDIRFYPNHAPHLDYHESCVTAGTVTAETTHCSPVCIGSLGRRLQKVGAETKLPFQAHLSDQFATLGGVTYGCALEQRRWIGST